MDIRSSWVIQKGQLNSAAPHGTRNRNSYLGSTSKKKEVSGDRPPFKAAISDHPLFLKDGDEPFKIANGLPVLPKFSNSEVSADSGLEQFFTLNCDQGHKTCSYSTAFSRNWEAGRRFSPAWLSSGSWIYLGSKEDYNHLVSLKSWTPSFGSFSANPSGCLPALLPPRVEHIGPTGGETEATKIIGNNFANFFC